MFILSINPIHSIIWVLIIILNIGCLLISKNIFFLCFILIIIYIGAITILFLFVIMMIDEYKLLFINNFKNYFACLFLLFIYIINLYFYINEFDFNYIELSFINSWNFELSNSLFSISKTIYLDLGISLFITLIILLLGLIASISIILKN